MAMETYMLLQADLPTVGGENNKYPNPDIIGVYDTLDAAKRGMRQEFLKHAGVMSFGELAKRLDGCFDPNEEHPDFSDPVTGVTLRPASALIPEKYRHMPPVSFRIFKISEPIKVIKYGQQD